MKLVCSKPNLLNCINIVQKAVSAKSTISVLEGILMETGEDSLTMTGNNLELGIECLFNADIREEGAVVVNSRLFGEIVRKLPEADIELEVIDGIIHIKCEHAYFKLNIISPEGFPELQTVEEKGSFRIKAVVLKDMVRRAMIAVSVDENRPSLTGVLFEINDDRLVLVSIDGFRMAMRETEIEGSVNRTKIVVPGNTLSELIKIIEIEDDEVNISYSDNYIMFSTDTKKLVSRLLEGEFPNYVSIIPKEEETGITVSRKVILDALERAFIVSSDEKKFPVVLQIENDQIIMTLNSDKASLREEIDIDMTGDKVQIGFNPRFLIEALRVIDDSEIIMNFRGSVGPCLIKPVEGGGYLYLIVPVKIRNI